MTKSVFSSKTFWFNTLSLLLGLAATFGLVQIDGDPAALADQIAGGIVAGVNAINIALRLVTREAVSL